MKNKFKGIFLGILIGIILTCGVGLIGNADTLYNVVTSGIKIIIDGKQLNPTDANGNRVEPIIYNGTTYLPIRAVADAIGKSVYWDGQTSTVYLGEMAGKVTYPSLYLKNANNIGAGYFPWRDMFKDNYGNSYTSAMGYVWTIRGSTAEYLLNGKYSRFKGVIAIEEGTTMPGDGSIIIRADGKEIYTSPAMTKSSAPVQLDLNITGCNDFQIEFAGRIAEKIYMADCGFYQ